MFNHSGKFLSFTLSPILAILILGLLPIEGNNLLVFASASEKPDPLLPPASVKRPLTEFEIDRIQRKINELNIQANTELSAGNLDKAFNCWYRELTLQRGIGREAEITALGRIGAIAWSNNRGDDLRAIAQRLNIIQQELATNQNLNSKNLELLGRAYEDIHYIDRAIELNRKLLAEARNNNDREVKFKILENLGNLYLATFDYSEAGIVYQELLAAISPTNNSRLEFYLDRSILIYAKTDRPKLAIATKQRLLKYYTDTNKLDKLAALNLSIARDYVLLNNFKAADRSYRQAFDLAFNSQQLALASDALTELGELYQKNDRTQDAIEVYQKLINVQQQSYNYYSLTNTYDKLGQIYQQIGDLQRAKMAFQQGLEIAKSLKYRIDYFTNRLNSIE